MCTEGAFSVQVHQWDVATASKVDSLHTVKAIYCIHARANGSGAVVAFGGADRALRIWDTRSRTGDDLVRMLSAALAHLS